MVEGMSEVTATLENHSVIPYRAEHVCTISCSSPTLGINLEKLLFIQKPYLNVHRSSSPRSSNSKQREYPLVGE